MERLSHNVQVALMLHVAAKQGSCNAPYDRSAHNTYMNHIYNMSSEECAEWDRLFYTLLAISNLATILRFDAKHIPGRV